MGKVRRKNSKFRAEYKPVKALKILLFKEHTQEKSLLDPFVLKYSLEFYNFL